MCNPIYLDHNATTPVLPEVVDTMLPYLRAVAIDQAEALATDHGEHPARDRRRRAAEVLDGPRRRPEGFLERILRILGGSADLEPVPIDPVAMCAEELAEGGPFPCLGCGKESVFGGRRFHRHSIEGFRTRKGSLLTPQGSNGARWRGGGGVASTRCRHPPRSVAAARTCILQVGVALVYLCFASSKSGPPARRRCEEGPAPLGLPDPLRARGVW